MDIDARTQATGGAAREPRVLNAPELAFDLDAELDLLRGEPGYGDFGRSSKTLARSGPLRVVLTAARRGVELGAFEAEGPVAVHVLDGEVTDDSERGVPFRRGSLIWFGAGGSWTIRVVEDAALLLAVAGTGDPEPAR